MRVLGRMLAIFALLVVIVGGGLVIKNQVTPPQATMIAATPVMPTQAPPPTPPVALVQCFDGSYQPITRGCSTPVPVQAPAPVAMQPPAPVAMASPMMAVAPVSTSVAKPIDTPVPRATPVSPTPIPVPTTAVPPTATPPPTLTPTVEMFNRDLLLCAGSCPMPPPMPTDGQVVLVHGDLNSSGNQCHYKVYQAGQKVPATFGRGTFRVVLIQGTPDYIQAMITQDVMSAAGAAPNGACPAL